MIANHRVVVILERSATESKDLRAFFFCRTESVEAMRTLVSPSPVVCPPQRSGDQYLAGNGFAFVKNYCAVAGRFKNMFGGERAGEVITFDKAFGRVPGVRRLK